MAALDALESAVERRREADRDEDELATRIQALGADRSRLADELDSSLVKSRKLERTNREIAERLDAAIGTIRAVLEAGERRMSHINVTINGRQYRMACEEGQEVRLLKLAESLETRVESLRGKFGEIGDQRLTVMAALTACDELLDAGNRIRNLEQELTSFATSASPPSIAPGRPRPRSRTRSTPPPSASRSDAGAEPHHRRRGGDRLTVDGPSPGWQFVSIVVTLPRRGCDAGRRRCGNP